MEVKNDAELMNEKDKNTFLVLLLIVLLIIIYIITFGKVNIGNNMSFPNEFKDTKEEAERKHKRLKSLVDKQETLKRKLNKRFKIAYFFVRLVFVGLWIGIIFVLWLFHVISSLSDILDWSEAILIFVVTINFLTFGNLKNIENYIHIIKTKIENWIYGKYIAIEKKIETNKSEIKEIENTIELMNQFEVENPSSLLP